MSLINSASLIVTPNGYKEGKLYSVIPSDGSGDMSVVRATTATRVNSAGLVELVPYNLAQYSQDFTNGVWGVGGYGNLATIVANDITAPDGTMTASKATFVAAGTQGRLIQSISKASGQQYTASFYLKQGNKSSITIYSDAASIIAYVTFDFTTGTITSSSNVSGSLVENVGNGWYRVSFASTTFITTAQLGFITQTGEDGFIYIWGAQLVEGSVAKDYQKTETRLNIPRLDYSNGTCPSLLVEPQRTNLLTYSSSFDDSSWVKVSSTISANNTISPSGGQDADKITENTSNGAFAFYKFVPSAAGANVAMTITCYVKYNGRNVRLTNSYLSDASNFDLQNGTVISNVGSGVGSIESVGNGWYRCALKTTTNGSGNIGLTLYLLNSSNNISYTGNGTSGVYAWGAQLEVGSYPTSYIPTTSASVTRNADEISKTGISSLIGQTEGTLFVDINFKVKANNNPAYIQTWYSQDERLGLFYQFSTNLIRPYLTTSSGSADFTLGLTPTVGQRYKLAFAYKANDYAFFVNGTQITIDARSTVPTAGTALHLGCLEPSAQPGRQGSEINAAALWQTRLTNDELERLTGTGFNTYAEMANYYNYITQ